MGKMNGLRRWFSLDDAPAQIARITGDGALTSRDVLELALQGWLTLSAVFPDEVRAAVCFETDNVEYNEVPSLDGSRTLKLPVGGTVHYAPNGAMLQAGPQIVVLKTDHPYDLPMMGGERETVLRKFWEASSVERDGMIHLDGSFVLGGRGTYLQLQGQLPKRRPASYYPLSELPENSVLVVTPTALADFESRLSKQTPGLGRRPSPLAERLSTWPWGSHHTELLAHLQSAGERFWANYDPTDNTTAPTNEAVVEWLKERKVSGRMAEAMATILRATGLPTGPRT